MSRKCQITAKKSASGNNVSHSQRKTKRLFKVNLHTKRLLNPATGRYMKVTLSTSALKTLTKWQSQGKKYDLKELVKAK